MKYRRPIDKKEDRLAFGVWPTVTLADVRAKRDDAKKLLVQGIDPKAEQKEVQAESAGAYTFETVARHYPALPPALFPEFLSRLAAYRGRLLTRCSVELMLLTFVRSSELRFA